MWIFLLIFCIVLLIALSNVYVSACFNGEGLCGFIRVFVFKIAFPKKKKEKTEKKSEPEGDKKKNGKLNELKLILESARCALGKFVRYLNIRNLYMDINIGTEDAFLTAMLYGGVAAGIGTLFPILNQNLKIKKKSINVTADFGAMDSTVYMEVTLSLRIWQIIVVAYAFAVQYLKKIINKRRDGKNGRARVE